jgi:hypothetical protein
MEALPKANFASRCFDLLSAVCEDPKALVQVFHCFVTEVIKQPAPDKPFLLTKIHTVVCSSGLLLDGLLLSIVVLNETGKGSATWLHSHLNKEYSKLDWSELKSSRLLRIREEPKHGYLDQCIYEILFSHSSVQELSKSVYCSIDPGEVFSLLSDAAKRTFVNAVILKDGNSPLLLLRRISSSSQSFVTTVFQLAEHWSLLIDDADAKEFMDLVKNMWTAKIRKTEFFGFFVSIILPNTRLIEPEFLKSLINSQDFPSFHPLFPAKEFVSDERCLNYVNFPVFWTFTPYYPATHHSSLLG